MNSTMSFKRKVALKILDAESELKNVQACLKEESSQRRLASRETVTRLKLRLLELRSKFIRLEQGTHLPILRKLGQLLSDLRHQK